MPNERLRHAIAATGLTLGEVAGKVEVDPKTIERWIAKDRVPHRSHRWAVASLLGSDEAYLWPGLIDDGRTQSASLAEFVYLYPHRGAVPAALWSALVLSLIHI